MSMKFFSEEWCQAAMEACNNSKEMYAGFKDPDTFTNRMEFGTLDKPEVRSHLEWEKAKIVKWVPAQTSGFPESDLWLIINGNLSTWQKAAEAETEGGKLLLAGKIRFAKGPMSAAIENAGAFNAFLASWGEVDTDWDV